MELTQECKSNYVAYFTCKINTLNDLYLNSLDRGSSCTENYLFRVTLATTLNEILCSINIDEDSCLTNEQMCKLIDNIKEVLKTKNCGC